MGILVASVMSLFFPAATFAAPTQAAANAGGIAPWKLAGASVSYWDSEVRLNLNGTTRGVATDDPNRLDWTFAPDAVVSLDGRYLAYVAADDRGYTNATITVVDLTSGAKTVVARPGYTIWPLLRWSPDSRQLAYVTQQPGTGTPQVNIVDADGTHQRMALSGGAFTRDSLQGLAKRGYGWSADGKSLIFHDNAVHPKTRWTVSLATGARSSSPYTGDSGSGSASTSPDVVCTDTCGGGGGSWLATSPCTNKPTRPPGIATSCRAQGRPLATRDAR
jgi:hypothetical protein